MVTYTFSFIRFSIAEIFHSELSLTSKDGNIAEKLMAPASASLAHLGFVLAGSRGRSWRSAASWPATEIKEGTVNTHSLVWGGGCSHH